MPWPLKWHGTVYRYALALASAARHSGAELYAACECLAGEMAAGSAGVEFLAGVAAIVLGIIALIAVSFARDATLMPVALLVVGLALHLTGSALSGLALSFMRPEQRSASGSPR